MSGKKLDLGSQLPHVESLLRLFLCHPLVSYAVSLSLSFHLYQMGISTVPTSVDCCAHTSMMPVQLSARGKAAVTLFVDSSES